jgi:signal transduction histidine kinase/ActR/RegA family two-component response regulator
MKRWFTRLPIHRKLVVMALLVTTVALLIANAGLLIIDAWRYRSTAFDEVVSIARVIAENTGAAVAFEDLEVARSSLESVRVRPTVRRACLYLADETLFAEYARSPEFACPPTQQTDPRLSVVVGTAPVVSNERIIGTVYVERGLADLWTRVAVAALTGLGMLLLAGGAALVLAHRLNRTVSEPIVQLAAAARAISPSAERLTVPAVPVGDDEIGDLVRAFSEMLRRVQTASAEREQLLMREREASRLKDEFLAAVSHELRTPLNAIMGWVQILMTTTANEQTIEKGIASIARNARAQTRVIEDLVDVSRIVTGKLNLRFDPVDLCEVIENAVDVTRASAQTKGVALQTKVPKAVCLVNGDRDRLHQIAWNLLSNAVKFTPPGGRVDVSLVSEDRVFGLTVADNGAGIPAAFLPHVFDRFRQADGSMTREHGGLGLGLAIVKELTELHGGTVQARSAGPGHGASFTVRLPQLAGLDLSDSGAREAARSSRLDGIDILAVDDNQDALDVLAAALAAAGATVRTVASGEEAVGEFDRAPAAVLLCDLAMPGVNGFDVLRCIRQRDLARGTHTVAIAVTAHASAHHHAESRDAGFDAHVSKPYDIGHLTRIIADAIGKASTIAPDANAGVSGES